MPHAPDDFDGTIAEQTVLAGQYEVLRKLGEGGMGEVHLAKDRHLNDRLVAIKTLPALRVASKRAMKQLRQEAAAMADLTHEHIVRFFHFGEHERIPFMVIQYIQGQTLDDLLGDKDQLTLEDTIELCTPVAEALDYAHSKQIIHRDIKPANIFIDDNNKPFLADFGIARIAKDTITQATGRDTTAGTLQYMSPEQCRGDWNLIPTSDIYSFAVVLYECLSGAVPFRTGPIRDLILNEPPPPLQIDHPIAELIMQGLSKDAQGRPSSCVALLNLETNHKIVNNKVTISSTTSTEPLIAQPTNKQCKHGANFTNSLGMKFVLINPKEAAPDGFLMGSPETEAGRDTDENQHRVILTKPYWLGVTPVTQSQYSTLMGNNPSYFKKKEGGFLGIGGTTSDLDDHPVDSVSWYDAKSFCEKLEDKTGQKICLPSEAEWEFACRAGSTTCFSLGDSEIDLARNTWYLRNSDSKTHAVGGREPNNWGLYDMHGNVWE